MFMMSVVVADALRAAAAVCVVVAAFAAFAAAAAAAAELLLFSHARVWRGSVQSAVQVSAPWMGMCTSACACPGLRTSVRLAGVGQWCKAGSLSRQRALAGRPGPLGGERGRCGHSGT